MAGVVGSRRDLVIVISELYGEVGTDITLLAAKSLAAGTF